LLRGKRSKPVFICPSTVPPVPLFLSVLGFLHEASWISKLKGSGSFGESVFFLRQVSMFLCGGKTFPGPNINRVAFFFSFTGGGGAARPGQKKKGTVVNRNRNRNNAGVGLLRVDALWVCSLENHLKEDYRPAKKRHLRLLLFF